MVHPYTGSNCSITPLYWFKLQWYTLILVQTPVVHPYTGLNFSVAPLYWFTTAVVHPYIVLNSSGTPLYWFKLQCCTLILVQTAVVHPYTGLNSSGTPLYWFKLQWYTLILVQTAAPGTNAKIFYSYTSLCLVFSQGGYSHKINTCSTLSKMISAFYLDDISQFCFVHKNISMPCICLEITSVRISEILVFVGCSLYLLNVW